MNKWNHNGAATKAFLQISPIIPVLVIENVNEAIPLARTLVDAGIKLLEVTLRTKAALASVELIRAKVPDAIVGVGTVLNKTHIEESLAAGAQFIFTPGMTENLLVAAKELEVPFVPGLSSISELMLGLEYGFSAFKLFPAESIGGLAWLKSVLGPFPEVSFCPTGGVNETNYTSYLALENVTCVGGSWMASKQLIQEGNWEEIGQRSLEAISGIK